MNYRNLLLPALAAVFCSATLAADLTVEKLFESLEAAGGSTQQMPEYGRPVVVVGTVLSNSSDGKSTVIMLGSPSSTEALARAVLADGASAVKVSKLVQGAAFEAECEVDVASGASDVPLHQCVLQ